MKNKRFKFIALILVIGVFAASGYIISGKIKQLESEISQLHHLNQQKDATLKILTDQTQVGQKELSDTKNELDNTKNELEKTNNELNNTQRELDNIKKELQIANKELHIANKILDIASKVLNTANKVLDTANNKLDIANKELEGMHFNPDVKYEK